jgi:glycerophosphoryl diester phosphodiesterase
MYDLDSTPATYAQLINFCIEQGATIMGPNIDYITGWPTSLYPWQGDMIRRAGLDIHAWTFNTQEQYLQYTGPWCDPNQEGGADKNYIDMAFTNHADIAIKYYKETLQGYADRGLNYFRSNAKIGMEDNLQKNKTLRTAQEVLDELGYK